jgi:hypothetical protein
MMIIPLGIAALITLLVTESKYRSEDANNPTSVNILDGIKLLMKDRALTIIALDKAIIHAAGVVGIWLYQGMLMDVGVKSSNFGNIHTGAVLIEVLMIAFATYVIKLFGSRKRYLLISSLIPAVGYLLGACALWQKGTIFGQILGCMMPLLVIGIGLSREPYFYKVENATLDDKSRATILSTIQMFTQAGTVIMYVLVGQGIAHLKIEVFLGLAIIMLIWRCCIRLPDRTNV